jgi:hypothetical protein
VSVHARVFLLAILAVAASPPSALAAPVVLHGSTGDGPGPDTATAAVAARDALGSGRFELEGELDALPELAGDGLLALGAELVDCGPAQRPPLAERLAKATTQVEELDFVAALKTLERGEPTAACGAGPLTPDSLYDLYFLAGYALFFSGEEAEAEALFTRAAAVDPGRKWNEDYPPTPKAAFLGALQAVLNGPGAALSGLVALPGLQLDGRPVVAGQPSPPAGLHVVDLGGRRSILTLPAWGDGIEIRLAARPQARAALLRGEAWAAPLLRAVARVRGWDDVLLVSDAGTVRFRAGHFVEPNLSAGAVARVAPAPPPPTRIAGVVLLGAGAAAVGVGFGLHGQAWRAGVPMTEDPAGNSASAYEALVQRNRAGFGVGVAGAGLAAAGLVLALLPPPRTSPDAAVSARPLLSAGPGGGWIGLEGSFR